jgi:hypothetical protein
MEQIFNTTPVEKDVKVKLTTSEFNITDPNHLILCVINAPLGNVKIDASMTLSKNDKTSSVPINFIELKGEPIEILEKLLTGAGKILASGIKKNEKDIKRIIVPNKEIQ